MTQIGTTRFKAAI